MGRFCLHQQPNAPQILDEAEADCTCPVNQKRKQSGVPWTTMYSKQAAMGWGKGGGQILVGCGSLESSCGCRD
ncbi:hypothetical protein VNO78_11092 [Psophocarpus tetragonolobus]|uniref:Uncharacterized protein n=1 Tax=Psophocarpus tetragonolobus TaxID=3891 RepID=A0AAN9SL55_PSOTE